MVWYGMVRYGMVWYGVVWYGMVWYGIISYRIVSYHIVSSVWLCICEITKKRGKSNLNCMPSRAEQKH